MSPMNRAGIAQSESKANNSTLIANEMKALERIKARQMKEIETVLDQEFRAQEIKEKNQQKEVLQKQKAARRALEIEEMRRFMEQKKLKSEQIKREKAEAEK